MRILGVVAAALLLASCGTTEWAADVQFKVTRINPGYQSKSGDQHPATAEIALDQDPAPGALDRLDTRSTELSAFAEDVVPGDAVTCKVTQRDDDGIVTTITNCHRR
ncbi:hypothetical protein [Actinosynnema sp. NPDC020468]|uniref:hypothetical protein n=1 Tax=Actinosynnema sp. NPDC020468 TaxID=3154488 RepID=UPI0033EFFE7C